MTISQVFSNPDSVQLNTDTTTLLVTGGMTIAQVWAKINARNSTAAAWRVQAQVHSGGTALSMVTGTLVSTPTAGNTLVAILRRADNNVISGPAGWSLIKAQGATTTRRVEVWAKIAVGGEATSFTFTTSAGTNAWRTTLLEIAGGRSTTPVTTRFATTAGSNPVSGTGFTHNATADINTYQKHALHIFAFATANTTISNPVYTLTGASQVTDFENLDPTSTNGGCCLAIAPANYNGRSYIPVSWTTARTSAECSVSLLGVGGAPEAAIVPLVAGTVGAFTGGNPVASECMQIWDLTGISASDIFVSAVLTMKSFSIGQTDDAELRAYFLPGGVAATLATAIITGSALTALDQIAHYPASVAHTTGYNTWTSDSAMTTSMALGAVNAVIFGDANLESGGTPTSSDGISVLLGGQSGTTDDPLLTITHTPSGPGGKNFFRLMRGAR